MIDLLLRAPVRSPPSGISDRLPRAPRACRLTAVAQASSRGARDRLVAPSRRSRRCPRVSRVGATANTPARGRDQAGLARSARAVTSLCARSRAREPDCEGTRLRVDYCLRSAVSPRSASCAQLRRAGALGIISGQTVITTHGSGVGVVVLRALASQLSAASRVRGAAAECARDAGASDAWGDALEVPDAAASFGTSLPPGLGRAIAAPRRRPVSVCGAPGARRARARSARARHSDKAYARPRPKSTLLAPPPGSCRSERGCSTAGARVASTSQVGGPRQQIRARCQRLIDGATPWQCCS